ncbi:ThuA domain-containing protein [Novipirellula sp. SH528]|uniref:ThuA domain-containing protein n=1 Tax=Novipirellula sp. SH528 TaxID=3454466 RepID=UPI003FA04666
MKTKLAFLILAAAMLPSFASAEPLRALIIDGQNNHLVWPKSTIMMRQYLEETGLFRVDVARTRFVWRSEREADWLPLARVTESIPTKTPQTDPNFKPDFSKYDVVISNFGYHAAPWPKETQAELEAYMRDGGGFVSVHAADNCFPDWKAYNEMIGIGGWDGRTEEHGPYVYVNKLGEVVRDDAPGICGKHGPKADFVVTMRAPAHPICQGLPEKWLHAYDECYAYMRGPAENLTLLGTAVSSLTQRSEPMLMTIEYHKGRIFHTTLGHDTKAFECVGFITTFKRGVQWAATGEVTQSEVPQDFPSGDAVSVRPFELKQ